ncbi:unnamed protein product [Allacma fusca]|uniref:Threonine synthase-like 2 n=1 Tax=Allacma fusca TaxID=39272 RepID=A0A8J2JWK4_9HEXA|nr:unnamed protein product [Allacma fusca]
MEIGGRTSRFPSCDSVFGNYKTMKYTSTRGGVSGLSFEDALFSGFAPDGGLFFPETIPQIAPETLGEWREAKLTYREVVMKVVRLFVTPDEIPDETLELCVARAYAKFFHSSVINFHSLRETGAQTGSASVTLDSQSAPANLKEDSRTSLVKVAELFHGRTGSFKDLALSLVGQFMEYFVNKRKRHVTILIGTSGDTGSAAIEAVRGMPGVDIVVLFPGGKVSPVQELQMLTVQDENVHVFQIEGTSDDTDVVIKQCFPQDGLTSCNSVNWARVMIQSAHFVYIYLLEGTPTNVIVPTGAGGNLFGGVLANRMGVPIKLHLTTNENDSMDILLRKGTLEMGGEVIQTPANAMDIRNPYNVERIFRVFMDSSSVASIIERAEVEGSSVEIPEEIVSQISKVIVSSMSVDTDLIYKTIKNCWEENHYMICPHTATALALFNAKFIGDEVQTSRPREPVYILSTASPLKFPEASEQLGISVEEWDGHGLLTKLQQLPLKAPKEMKLGDDWVQILQNEINSTKYSHM